jgi:methyltransferase (TIGR00027 family)
MNEATESNLRNIGDTARWVATFRAQESARPDALFRDPFAERLAGSQGWDLLRTLTDSQKHAWAFVLRTHLFDQHVLRAVADGADLVLNLAAGLDTRPYRLPLPPSLTWVEVDRPDVLRHKESVLADATPTCKVERFPLDLADPGPRRELFARVGGRATRALVLTEGLIIYLDPSEVATLAEDLAAVPAFAWWATDIASPGLLAMMQRGTGARLAEAGMPLKFAPVEGPDFFRPYGWVPVRVESVFKAAARLRRVSWPLRLLALLPERRHPGSRPWSGICLLGRPSQLVPLPR